jgi:hypothetical protein
MEMGRMQDERWEFDLDLPRSEKDDPVRGYEMVRAGWINDGDLYCVVRERGRSSGLVYRGWLRRHDATVGDLLA